MTDIIQDSDLGENAASSHNEQNGTKGMHAGRNIAAIRRGRGISQEYVALKLGKSQQTVSNIESMEEVPEEVLVQIAKILSVTPEYIKNYDLERLITNNTQIINEGGKGDFFQSDIHNDNSITNSLDVIKYIVAENKRLHAGIITEKNETIKQLKAEIKLCRAEIKRLNDELQKLWNGNRK